MTEVRRGRRGRKTAAWLILASFALFPALLAALLAPFPRTREIHIEAFRYGFSPSRIEVNRGDRLRLTFSTRDTGQSFFLQDYDLHVVITPGTRIVEVHRLSRPDEPPVRQEVVELTAGLPGWSGWLVSKSQFRNHTYNGPLHGTERGDLVVRPNYLLDGGLGFLFALPLVALLLRHPGVSVSSGKAPINLFALFPGLKRLVKRPSLQFDLTLPMLAVFYFVILAGLLGTKVSGRNAGPMVIWVLWLSALIVLLVPLGGRIWCLVCPLPSLGEWLQRRRFSAAAAPVVRRSSSQASLEVARVAAERLAAHTSVSAPGDLQHDPGGCSRRRPAGSLSDWLVWRLSLHSSRNSGCFAGISVRSTASSACTR